LYVVLKFYDFVGFAVAGEEQVFEGEAFEAQVEVYFFEDVG
jgi:hypothetical protein